MSPVDDSTVHPDKPVSSNRWEQIDTIHTLNESNYDNLLFEHDYNILLSVQIYIYLSNFAICPNLYLSIGTATPPREDYVQDSEDKKVQKWEWKWKCWMLKADEL